MTEKRKDLPCAVVRDLLPLYHDGVVSSDTSELIEAHLEGCESCRDELNSIRTDESIGEKLIEKDASYFNEFRDGVKALRRNGTIRGVLIAAALVAVFIVGIAFLNNEAIVKVDPADLDIGDVCRCDFGTDGGDGLFFTYQMNWDGGYSITFDDSKDQKEINVAIKRTALGGKMRSDVRNPYNFFIIDDFYKDSADLSEAEIVKVNGQTIWTKDQGTDKEPPEFIKELKEYEHYDVDGAMKPEDKVISASIDKDSVSITYADFHGIKWDKAGNIIATFTVDEDGDITSLESYPGKS